MPWPLTNVEGVPSFRHMIYKFREIDAEPKFGRLKRLRSEKLAS